MNALTANRRKEIVSPDLPKEVTMKDTSHLDDAEFVLATSRGRTYRIALTYFNIRTYRSQQTPMHILSVKLEDSLGPVMCNFTYLLCNVVF